MPTIASTGRPQRLRSAVHAHDEDAVHAWAARDAAMQDYQQRGGAGTDPTARTAGPRPTAPGLPETEPGFDPTQPTGLTSTTNAARILSARKAIDDRIDYSGPTTEAPSSALRSQQGAYQQARAGLSDALREQVPGYADATDALAGINRQRDAMNDGLEALGSGRQAIRPDDFATMFAALSPEEQAAYRVGMRANVDQALGTRPNDFQALKGVTQGENGWNAAKLSTAFGQPNVDAINQGIARENLMAANNARINGNSNTSSNEADRALTQPDTKTGLLGWIANMRPLDQPATMLPPFLHPQNLGEKFQAGAYEAARKQVAPLLMKQGPEADALMSALLAQAKRKAAIAPLNTDPLTLALMGAGQYARQQMPQ